jgi:carboxypeptidase A4
VSEILLSGIHAREWIAPAAALYVIDSLVKAFAASSVEVTNVDWYIMPLLNPDGYEFSHTDDRWWRKNRAKPKQDWFTGIFSFFLSLLASIFNLNNGTECYGVDLNRNYDVVGRGVGASTNPCSNVYKGEMANSEPEVKAASNVIMRNKDKLKASLSFHSYGIVVNFGGFAK